MDLEIKKQHVSSYQLLQTRIGDEISTPMRVCNNCI